MKFVARARESVDETIVVGNARLDVVLTSE
jgi:hypothetical protein